MASRPLEFDSDPWGLRGDFVSPGYAAFPATIYAELVSEPAGVIWSGTFDGVSGGYGCTDFVPPSAVPQSISFGTDFIFNPVKVFTQAFVVTPAVASDLTVGTNWSVDPARVFATPGIAGVVPSNLTVGTDWVFSPTQIFAVAGL